MATMFFEQEVIFDVYFAAIETYEKAHAQMQQTYLQEGTLKTYPTIVEDLRQCSLSIDEIISFKDQEDSLMLSVFQLRHEISVLVETIEAKYKQNINENKQATSNLQSKHKKPSFADNNSLPSIVQNTIETPKVTGLGDIVGLHEIKMNLKSVIILPQTQPQLFLNIKVCNTILLFGPPGTGKTRLVHALAAEAGAILHCISASDLLSHYVGQTEKTIKTLFKHLKDSTQFSLLFIDEVDGFCRKRSDNEQEHTRRFKTELMCQLSNIDNCTNLLVICATNCPWDLDTAILRRFQKRLYIPLPNHWERLQFFQYFTNGIHIEGQIDVEPLLKKTDGYSGSDLANLVQNAFYAPLTELEDTHIWKINQDGFYEPYTGQDSSGIICSELKDLPKNSVRARKVQMIDFLNAADSISSTVSSADVEKYNCFNNT